MKIVAVQLNLKFCKSYKVFYDYLEEEVFSKISKDCDLLVFPENINLCLLFAKNDLEILNVRSVYEKFIDWLISLLNLSFYSLFNIPEIIFASGELTISLAVLAISVTF